jgi:replicative DNA helicase
LKGRDGGTLRVDRKGRPPEHIKRPALTFGLAIQPAVLRALTDQPGFRGRGLLARFLWVLPTSYVRWRDINPPPAGQTVVETYATRLGAVVEHLAEWADPAVLTPGYGAHDTLVAWAGELEPRLRPTGDLVVIRDWVAKLVGQTARLAALLHLAEPGQGAVRRQVAVAHTNAAVALGRYFLAHP